MTEMDPKCAGFRFDESVSYNEKRFAFRVKINSTLRHHFTTIIRVGR
jgi:hypothetical protein